MANLELERKIREYARTLPLVGMATRDGWTWLEVRRALERIGAGMAVSNSEYTVAMGFFWRAHP